MLEDVNDEIPLFTEREQETVLEGEPIGTKVTQVNAIDKDGTFPNNQVRSERRNLLSKDGFNVLFHYRFIITSSTHPGTKGKSTLKLIYKVVKSSQKLFSTERRKVLMHWKLKLGMEHNRLDRTAMDNQIQVGGF